MEGGSGAGTTIGCVSVLIEFSLITIGPGFRCGRITGGGAGLRSGIDTTIDGGGPDGTIIGLGLRAFFGKFMKIGPVG